MVIVTTTTIFWLFLLPITLKGETENPYLGMLAFLTIPGPFFGGLILIPLGMWLKRRREGRTGIYPPEFPTAHLEQSRIAQAGLFRRRHHRCSTS